MRFSLAFSTLSVGVIVTGHSFGASIDQIPTGNLLKRSDLHTRHSDTNTISLFPRGSSQKSGGGGGGKQAKPQSSGSPPRGTQPPGISRTPPTRDQSSSGRQRPSAAQGSPSGDSGRKRKASASPPASPRSDRRQRIGGVGPASPSEATSRPNTAARGASGLHSLAGPSSSRALGRGRGSPPRSPSPDGPRPHRLAATVARHGGGQAAEGPRGDGNRARREGGLGAAGRPRGGPPAAERGRGQRVPFARNPFDNPNIRDGAFPVQPMGPPANAAQGQAAGRGGGAGRGRGGVGGGGGAMAAAQPGPNLFQNNALLPGQMHPALAMAQAANLQPMDSIASRRSSGDHFQVPGSVVQGGGSSPMSSVSGGSRSSGSRSSASGNSGGSTSDSHTSTDSGQSVQAKRSLNEDDDENNIFSSPLQRRSLFPSDPSTITTIQHQLVRRGNPYKSSGSASRSQSPNGRSRPQSPNTNARLRHAEQQPTNQQPTSPNGTPATSPSPRSRRTVHMVPPLRESDGPRITALVGGAGPAGSRPGGSQSPSAPATASAALSRSRSRSRSPLRQSLSRPSSSPITDPERESQQHHSPPRGQAAQRQIASPVPRPESANGHAAGPQQMEPALNGYANPTGHGGDRGSGGGSRGGVAVQGIQLESPPRPKSRSESPAVT